MKGTIRLLLGLLLLPATLLSQTPPISKGVLFDDSDVPRFRTLFASDSLFAGLRADLQNVDRDAERKFLRTEVRLNDHLYDIARVGNMAMQMAFLYLYSGDEDAAVLARQCIETLMKFPRWDYFLDGGKDVIGLQRAPNSALAVSVVVEALGELVPPKDRERWLTAMADRGVEPCFRSTYGMRYPDRVKGWGFDPASTYLEHRPGDKGLDLSRWPIILNTINLKAVPASALAISALTYRKYMGDSEKTARWIEQAVYSIGTFRDIYARDGSYDEGVSYSFYTTLHLVEAIEALRRTGVADITDLLNWQGYLVYLLEMTQPTAEDPYAIVNFSDAAGGAQASVSFWIAKQTRDPLAQWFGEHLAAKRDMWSLLWYDRTVTPEAPDPRPHIWHSDLDWIVARTGYGKDDLVMAMRSGGPFNHEHADRNSLILKCFGEKLVVDPMRPPYSFTDPSWRMRLTEGHSALLIDGKSHQYVDGREGTNSSQAKAEVIRSGERNGYLFWTSDATQAYSLVIGDVASVTRTVVALTGIPAVVVVDKVIKKTEPSRIQARFYGYNNDGKGKITADGDSFTIVRPLAMLGGRSIANGPEEYRSALPPIPAEEAAKFPFAEVGTTRPAKESFLLTVLLPFTADAATVQLLRDGNTYRAHIGGEMSATEVIVTDTGEVPEFEVK